MKKSFLGSLLVILLMVTCSKEQHTKETASTDIGTIEVSEHFEWRMSRNIALTLYNETPQLFEISSPDGSLRYHKGNHPGDNQAYPVSISMPFTENKLLVNGAEYTINSKSYKINNIQNKAMNAPFIDGYQLSREGSIENYALLFDGVEDYLNLGDIAELNEVNAFSIEGWANPNNTSATATIFSKTASDAYDIQLRTEGGKLVVELGNGSNSFGSWGDYAWSIANGSWFHWALTFDGAAVGNAERLKLYINGAAVPLDFSGNIPASTSAQLQGNSAFISAVNNSFSGVMDEVRIWSVARTADEIQALQGQIIPPMATYLAAYWRFDEADGNIINDETDHAYHGTLVGSS